jgi:DNA-binding response OmpR family regulator
MQDILTLKNHTDGISVLIAEDYEPVRDGLKNVLSNYFHDIALASDGKEALELYDIKDGAYDIIISDVEMPYMNGVDLSKEIYKRNPHQQILIISAHKDSDNLIEFVNMGVNRFISKPIDTNELIKTLLDVTKSLKEPKNQKMLSLEDDYMWDQENQLLFLDGQIVDFTKYELIFFKLLVQNTNETFDTEKISKHFMQFNIELDQDNIRNMVAKLRKKISKNLIENVYAKGYRVRVA